MMVQVLKVFKDVIRNTWPRMPYHVKRLSSLKVSIFLMLFIKFWMVFIFCHEKCVHECLSYWNVCHTLFSMLYHEGLVEFLFFLFIEICDHECTMIERFMSYYIKYFHFSDAAIKVFLWCLLFYFWFCLL